MTLTRLAEIVGTSVSTVSKAFSGSREVSSEMRERIYRVARENGCFDKYYKAPRERPMIALLFPEPESEFYGMEIGLIESALNARGADTIISFTRFDREREARLFRELAYKMRVDGVIIAGSGALISNPDEIPLVTIGGECALANSDNVYIDMERGIDELMRILKEYGHKNVGFIGERLTSSKEKKIKHAMRRAGLSVHQEYFATSERRFAEAGEECMRMLIEREAIPSVIIAAYDQIAYGAMRYANQLGYGVPDDISFVGMDDISVTTYLNVPLSSLHTNLEDVCDRIVDLIFKRIENRHYRGRTEITIPVTVKIRESLKKLV